MSEIESPSRTEVVLAQAFGAEFEYYRTALRQPENTVLLKLGGMTVAESLGMIAHNVRTLVDLDVPVVIVHGAGPQIDHNLAKQGIIPRKTDGIRETDEATLEVVEDTLVEVNHTIAEALAELEIPTRSFNRGLFDAEFTDWEALGFVGDIVDIQTDLVHTALAKHAVPVISCLGTSVGGTQPLNINADTASSALAIELGVHKFMVLTDEGGVLDKSKNIIPVITTKDGRSEVVDRLIEEGVIYEGMIPKIREVLAAVEQLPENAAVITHPRSVIRELFTHTGEGTLVRKGDTIVHHSSVSAFSMIRLRKLIEDSFNGTLNGDYFEQLPRDTEVFATARLYDGAAIIIPGKTEDAPAYLDKIVVPPAAQGAGVGGELIDAAISRYPGGLFWRTKTSNEAQIKWYSKIADTQTTEGDWVIFMSGVDPQHRDACVRQAIARPLTIAY